MNDELEALASAKAYIIRALSRRMLSEAELRTRLKRREYDADTIDTCVAWTLEYQLINDAAVSESIAREADRTCRGPKWVEQKSRQRGVPVFKEASEEHTVLLERALRYLEPRYEVLNSSDRIEQQKHKRRWLARLARRGFPSSVAFEALSRMAERSGSRD